MPTEVIRPQRGRSAPASSALHVVVVGVKHRPAPNGPLPAGSGRCAWRDRRTPRTRASMTRSGRYGGERLASAVEGDPQLEKTSCRPIAPRPTAADWRWSGPLAGRVEVDVDEPVEEGEAVRTVASSRFESMSPVPCRQRHPRFTEPRLQTAVPVVRDSGSPCRGWRSGPCGGERGLVGRAVGGVLEGYSAVAVCARVRIMRRTDRGRDGLLGEALWSSARG